MAENTAARKSLDTGFFAAILRVDKQGQSSTDSWDRHQDKEAIYLFQFLFPRKK